jgi:hypothetical protein
MISAARRVEAIPRGLTTPSIISWIICKSRSKGNIGIRVTVEAILEVIEKPTFTLL